MDIYSYIGMALIACGLLGLISSNIIFNAGKKKIKTRIYDN